MQSQSLFSETHSTFEFKKFQKKWFQTGHMKYSFFSLEHKTGGNLRAAIGGLSGVQKTNSSLRSEATVNMLRESPQTSEYLESQICERSWCRSIEREQALWRRCQRLLAQARKPLGCPGSLGLKEGFLALSVAGRREHSLSPSHTYMYIHT